MVLKEIDKLKIDPNKVIAVFLTHTDQNHVAAISFFPNAKVYLAEDEERMIDGSTRRILLLKNKLDVDHYQLIKDQESLKIGTTTIKGILTPGHTPGSMSYLVNGKYLFTGDLLSLEDSKIGIFSEFFDMDTKIHR